ncbi:MMS19 nucleotide excision repair protein homolog isoform X2 [Primulina huaijiensis]|uniref:MMS19 nucleotide excision repair protein homolog isoform X2 n=1 Tax=Primulina huaijiensis TaxID=1492673 RepID=UPI003CC7355E
MFTRHSYPSGEASVSAVATLLKNDMLTIEALVREMEMYLTTTDHIIRSRGILLLAEVLDKLTSKPLTDTSIHSLIGFFSERLVSKQ